MLISRAVGGCLLGLLLAAPASSQDAAAVHGRIEEVGDGLKILHVWGSPAERGYAHGLLLSEEIVTGAVAEFTKRFAKKPHLLELARTSLGRLIVYPEDVRAELEALFRGLVDSKVSLHLPALDRDFDLQDLLVTNALDVFGLMGCSGITVWGDKVAGGGVLTARNFDWPFTGAHMLEGTVLLVQHRPGCPVTASVTWPGYVATVTGVSSAGVAAFLHVGSAKITMAPEPDSWPTAVAARRILEQLDRTKTAKQNFDKARALLSHTSPPAGFLTRVVLPVVPENGPPVAVFETDSRKSVQGENSKRYSVVTNHFTTREDGRKAAGDSLGREEKLCAGVEGCFDEGDEKVSIEEAWQLLSKVERGGGRRFGTLHALVFRDQPWCFELRIAVADEKGRVVAATQSSRRFALTREQVFGAGEPGK